MPLSSAAHVLKITMVGSIFNEECLNVFYYGNIDVVTGIDDVLTEFAASPLGDILSILSSAYRCHRIDGEVVKGGTTLSTLAIESNGTIGGACLPPTNCWDFTLIRGGAKERNGYKRFSGVAESSQDDGVATTGISASLQSVATALAADLTPGVQTWFPLIRRTRVNRVPQNPPVYYEFDNAAYSKIGTQNSRKFGHGR